ncbi:hypothetical protein L596_019094 [Steinernema carpocapsae]|uniref:Molybdopterin synthase sulfur carrier subunit n=1 Tax=Steinernema carpocapsae TaxID=34508 RepID=A0A4U5N6N5_STECR|nr:hypothetical protein L596_019094 [Steinernema carpocapsae]
MAAERIEVTVLLFGKAKELAGSDQATVTLDSVISYSDLKKTIFESIEGLAPIKSSCMLAVEQNYLTHDDLEIHLRPTSELAVIPPLSGG